jgi:hypothetical protein
VKWILDAPDIEQNRLLVWRSGIVEWRECLVISSKKLVRDQLNRKGGLFA